MRTSVDIPEPVYRQMKVKAATEGTTIREIILEGIEMSLRKKETPPRKSSRARFPAIKSKHPGSIKLGEEGVYEYIPFP
jgi:hypothetical protein